MWVNWKCQNAYQIVAYNILRSDTSSTKGFLKLNDKPIDKYARSYLDLKVNKAGYYKVEALDAFGQKIESEPYLFSLRDTIPPAIPVGLTGFINKKGQVELKWTPNTEKDILGYRVFKRNNPIEEPYDMTHRAHCLVNLFLDTMALNSLTPNIEYGLKAVDKNYNESKFSNFIILKRPDTIPPSMPQFKSIIVQKEEIKFEIIPSRSADALTHDIYRYDKESDSNIKIYSYTKNSKSPIKTLFSEKFDGKHTVTYKIVVRDEYYNTRSNTSGQYVVNGLIVGEVPNFKVIVERDKSQVTLNWGYPKGSVGKWYIYRGKEGGKLSLLTTLGGSSNHFEDKNLEIETQYSYAIKAEFQDETVTKLTRVVTVQY
jgi:uncharacterized protein